jgi:protein-disulfide isomerase
VAAVCADEQGRFAEMHRRLMATEIWADTTQAPWREMARNAGVPDQKGFDACLESVRAHARVDVDVLLAGRIGIAGTPTFLTRDRVLEGPQSVASLTSALELETRR